MTLSGGLEEQILELPTFEWDLEPGDRVKVREATTGRSRGLRSPLVDATVAGDGSCLLDDEGHTIIASEVYQTDDGPDLIRIPPGAELPCCPATGKVKELMGLTWDVGRGKCVAVV
eukprot:scaffold135_cov249-Pinguiococcus_pyrenoidosus.AAC.14